MLIGGWRRHIKEMYPMMWKKAVAFTQVLNQHVHENAEAGETLQGVVEINHFGEQCLHCFLNITHI